MGPCASPCRAGDQSATRPRSPSRERWIEKQLQRIEAGRNDERQTRAVQRRPTVRSSAQTSSARWRARARSELPARLLDLAAQHGLTVSRVSVRNQKMEMGIVLGARLDLPELAAGDDA